MTRGPEEPVAGRRAQLWALARQSSTRAARWLRSSYRLLLGEVAGASMTGILFVLVAGLLVAMLGLMIVNAVLLRLIPTAIRPQTEMSSGESFRPLEVRIGLPDPAEDAPQVQRRYAVAPAAQAAEQTGAYRSLLEIDLVEERTSDAYQLALDLHCWQEPRTRKRLEWWTTKGLAISGDLIRVRPAPYLGWFLKELDFPTSPQALTTYTRSYFMADAREINPAYRPQSVKPVKPLDVRPEEMDRKVAGELDRVFTQELERVRTAWPVVVLRILNGVIQWLTLGTFFAVMMTVWARSQVFVHAEHHGALRLRLPGPKHRTGDAFFVWVERQRRIADAMARAHEGRWGVRSISLAIWRHALDALLKTRSASEVATAAERFGELEQSWLDSRGFNLRYLVGAMPALGFVGTVWGIGDALMRTGGVLSHELARQQSGVSTVALALSVAFDTTLVALVLSLMALFWTSWLSAAEEKVVLATRQLCQENLQPWAPAEAAAAPPLPPPAAPALPGPPAGPAAGRPAPAPARAGPALADRPEDYQADIRRPSALLRNAVFAAVLGAGLYLLLHWWARLP